MEKIERRIYGFLFLLGGVFLFIFAGSRLIDSLSKTIFFFLSTNLIILTLYGVILILIGTLIMSVNVRVKKSVALIIFWIGILIVIISITVIIIDFFLVHSSVIIGEIFSGIVLIYLGIRLFFPNKEIKKKENEILGIIILLIGLIISLSYGFSIIMTMVFLKPENILLQFPYDLLPFLIGIILLIFGKYSMKITLTTQERKNKAVFSIWMGIAILLISNFSIMSMINHSYYYFSYFPYYPLLYLFIGIVLILHGFYLQHTIRKRSLNKAVLPILRFIFILLIFLYILLSFSLVRVIYWICNLSSQHTQ